MRIAVFFFLSAMPSLPLLPRLSKIPLLKVEQLVSGLNAPTTMAFIGPDDILVLQKNDGRVRRIIGGVLQPGHVADVAVDKPRSVGS